MGSNTLDELDRNLLESLAEGSKTLEALESAFDVSESTLRDRLSRLVDTALVRAVDADGETYEATENGRRLLEATPAGARDDRIDTPAHVEDALESMSLRPDEAAAVRNAFSFLRYWGDATTAELIDGVYSETPAGYGTAAEWWDDCVRDRLAALPDVGRSSSGTETVDTVWQYEGRPVVDSPDDRDGRVVSDPITSSGSIGSVRHGLERRFSSAELWAARVAFAVVFESRQISVRTLADCISSDPSVAHEAVDDWTNWAATVFSGVPDIERECREPGDPSVSKTNEEAETMRTVVWRYRSYPETR